MSKARIAVPLLLLGGLPGCTGDFRVEPRALGSYSTLFGEADTRMIEAAPTRIDIYGKNVPTQITCAEPSPDVAKAISTAFGAGGAITVNVNGAPGTPGQVGEAAAAISKSRAEAIAQLGERMASTQLLRDGLFRACEAFQNGALSPTSYALVLSRYGDTMVTMLGSELIAGEFGRTGASASSQANGSANAAIQQATEDAQKAADALTAAQGDLTTARADQAKDRTQVDQEKAKLAPPATTSPTLESAQQALAAQDQVVKGAEAKVASALTVANATAKSAAATSQAAATGTGVGGLNRTPEGEGSRRIADLVRGYMSTPTIHSIMTACISVLEDNNRSNTNLGDFCRQSMGGFAYALREGYDKAINGLAHTSAEAEYRQIADRIKRLQQTINSVKAAVNSTATAPAKKKASPGTPAPAPGAGRPSG